MQRIIYYLATIVLLMVAQPAAASWDWWDDDETLVFRLEEVCCYPEGSSYDDDDDDWMSYGADDSDADLADDYFYIITDDDYGINRRDNDSSSKKQTPAIPDSQLKPVEKALIDNVLKELKKNPKYEIVIDSINSKIERNNKKNGESKSLKFLYNPAIAGEAGAKYESVYFSEPKNVTVECIREELFHVLQYLEYGKAFMDDAIKKDSEKRVCIEYEAKLCVFILEKEYQYSSEAGKGQTGLSADGLTADPNGDPSILTGFKNEVYYDYYYGRDCSEHFFEGIPQFKNDYPGYNFPEKHDTTFIPKIIPTI